MPSTYHVAWWNLENLFDEENSPRRTEKLQRAIAPTLLAGHRLDATERSPSSRRSSPK